MSDEQIPEPKDQGAATGPGTSRGQRSGVRFPEQAPLSPEEIEAVELRAKLDDLDRLVVEQPRILGDAEPESAQAMYGRESEQKDRILLNRLITKMLGARLREIAELMQRLSDARQARNEEGEGK